MQSMGRGCAMAVAIGAVCATWPGAASALPPEKVKCKTFKQSSKALTNSDGFSETDRVKVGKVSDGKRHYIVGCRKPNGKPKILARSDDRNFGLAIEAVTDEYAVLDNRYQSNGKYIVEKRVVNAATGQLLYRPFRSIATGGYEGTSVFHTSEGSPSDKIALGSGGRVMVMFNGQKHGQTGYTEPKYTLVAFSPKFTKRKGKSPKVSVRRIVLDDTPGLDQYGFYLDGRKATWMRDGKQQRKTLP